MQKRALKEIGKQRECLMKGVVRSRLESQRKKIDPKEQKGRFLLGFESNLSLVCTIQNTAYNTYQFLIWKIRYIDTLPPPVLYRVYTVPYITYNYTYTVLANPTHYPFLSLPVNMCRVGHNHIP